MPDNPHFAAADSWDDARRLVTFEPRQPSDTDGCALESLRVFVRDHTMRDVPMTRRSLEAHYGRFVFSQSAPGADEARESVLERRYGQAPQEASIVGREARAYAMGPEAPPDDIDGRMPAVVVWYEDDRFFLVASGELRVDVLIRIAGSVYRQAPERGTPR